MKSFIYVVLIVLLSPTWVYAQSPTVAELSIPTLTQDPSPSASLTLTPTLSPTPTGDVRVTEIKVNGSTMDITGATSLTLPLQNVSAGQPFVVDIAITFSDSTTQRRVISFKYTSPTPTPIPTAAQSSTGSTRSSADFFGDTTRRAPAATQDSTQTPTTYAPAVGSGNYDLNSDGKINALDASLFKQELRKPASQRDLKKDFNGDSAVNNFDYSSLLKNLGR